MSITGYITGHGPPVVATGLAVGDRIGYARVSTADQDPQLQLDALSAAECLKVDTATDTDTDTATATATNTKADRPQWNACLAAFP